MPRAKLPEHSPVGASSAHRFIPCPASVPLAASCAGDDEDDTYSKVGTAAHKVAATALNKSRAAFEFVGKTVLGVKVDAEMSNAVQVYLDYVNALPVLDCGPSFVEERFHCPSIHQLFYGTTDFATVLGRKLVVADYKHGAGIVVEAKDNPQLLYYAAGILEKFKLWDRVDLIEVVIVQPRGWHSQGPIRDWSISTVDLRKWLDGTLVPAIERALEATVDQAASGEHCRFCPVRLRKCPRLWADVEELKKLMAQDTKAQPYTATEVGRLLDLGQVFKIAHKAALQVGTAMLNRGVTVPGWKLSPARTNREWRPEAEKELIETFGDEAFKPKELISPADAEKKPLGEALAAKYAFKPDGGLTLTPDSDPRPAVNKDTKSLFTPQSKLKGKK